MEPHEPPRKHYATKPREFERVNAPAGSQPKSDEHDIFVMLQQNRTVEQHHGQHAVVIKKTRSRRKRDYWLLLVPSNLLIALLTWSGRDNPYLVVCGLTGMVLASLIVTWIMWQVMGDY